MKIQNHYEFPEFDHRAVPSRQREQHRRSWSPSAPPELVLGGAASRKLGNFQTPFLGRITPPLTKALLARFAKAAGAGAYEKAIGHETSKSTIYNLLARHGWRKLMPRPFHPKRDIAAQDAFKKMAFQML